MTGKPHDDGTAAAWALWAAPDRSRRARVVTASATPTPFRLAGMYSRVDVWVTDAAAAATMTDLAGAFGDGVEIELVDLESLPGRLAEAPEGTALIAFEELLSGIPRASRGLRDALLSGLGRATRAAGQGVVVDRSRFAIDDLRAAVRHLRPGPGVRSRPTRGEVLRGLRAGGADPGPWLFFHPDHRRPDEILGWNGTLPGSRRGRVDRVLEATGIARSILGSFACFASNEARPTVLDEAVGLARPWMRDAGDPVRGTCVVRDNGMVLFELGLGGADEAILRVPLTADARAALDASIRASRALETSHPRIHERIPEVLAVEAVHGWTAHIERKCVGATAHDLLTSGIPRARIREQILRFVLDLHLPSKTAHTVDDPFVERHFEAHAAIVREAEPGFSAHLDALVRWMAARSRGARLPTVRIHGDLNVGNVLFDPETHTLRTVLDWDASLPDSLPFDLIHYLISENRVFDGRDWGSAIARIVTGGGLDDDGRALLDRHHDAIGLDGDVFLPFLCAYWLRGVAVRLQRSGGQLAATWRERNLRHPLDAITSLIS